MLISLELDSSDGWSLLKETRLHRKISRSHSLVARSSTSAWYPNPHGRVRHQASFTPL